MDLTEFLMILFLPLLAAFVIVATIELDDKEGNARAIGWRGQRWVK